MVGAALFHVPKTKLFGGAKMCTGECFSVFLCVFFLRGCHKTFGKLLKIRRARQVELKKQEIPVLALQPNNGNVFGPANKLLDLSFVINTMGIIKIPSQMV